MTAPMFHPSTCLSLQSAAVDSRKDSRWTHIVEHNWFERNCAFEIAVVVVVVVVVVAVVNEMVHLSYALHSPLGCSTGAVLPYIQIQAGTLTALRNRFGHDLFECPLDRY